MLLLTIVIAFKPFAQTIPSAGENILELAAEQSEADADQWEEFEYDMQFRKSIDINKVSAEELMQLGILSELQINQFVHYRKLLGPFVHVNELQAVPGWHPYLIKGLIAYLQVISTSEKIQLPSSVQSQLSIRLAGLGNKTSSSSNKIDWIGNEQRIVLQYKLESKFWKIGGTAKKDPGESLWKKGMQHGFDFFGVHAFYKGKGLLQVLAVGDYTVNLGQGLIHWQAMSLRKSGLMSLVKKQGPVFKVHRAAGEFNFHRGLALQVKKNRWDFHGFISRRGQTATLTYDSLGHALSVKSINSSGYHRTLEEIASKNSLTEWVTGVRVSRQSATINWGLNGVAYHLNIPWEAGKSPYQRYRVTGRLWYNASLDYSFTFKNWHGFGEIAVDKRNNLAFLAGIVLSPDSKVDISLVFRSIAADYQSFYSSAFTESTLPTNERGCYAGISIRPNYQWQIDAYTDLYHFPWLRYRISSPVFGNDHQVQISYKPDKRSLLLFRFRTEQKPEDPSEDPLEILRPAPLGGKKSSARLHFEKTISSRLFFRIRAEITSLLTQKIDHSQVNGQAREMGYLSFWEFRYRPQAGSANYAFRVQYFDTESYKSRVYAFQSSPGGGFSVIPSSGRGLLLYFIFSKKLKNRILTNSRVAVSKSNSSDRWQWELGTHLVLKLHQLGP